MKMGPSLRKFMLALHITASVGWIGAVVAYIPLDITAAASQDDQTLRAAYLGMDVIVRWAIIPLALAGLASGLVVSLGTNWGLFRHYWVIVSLALTAFATIILIIEAQAIAYFAATARDPAASADQVRALGNSLGHSIGGLVLLLVVLALNVYKPRGVTPYGWRKQQEEQARRE